MEQKVNTKAIEGASNAALAAMAYLARLDEADRATVLRAFGLALGPRLWRVQDGQSLPTLTGIVEDRERERIYASSAWQQAYRPSRTLVIYVLQTAGCAWLSALLGGVGISKVGTADLANVERRIRELGRAEYGAWVRGDRRYEKSPGFTEFVPAKGVQLAPQHPASPVRLGLFGLEVGLPMGLSMSRYEAEFDARLLPLRLQVIADTEIGRALCARAGADPNLLRRFYKPAGTYKAATELTLCRPRADSTALAKIAADIVIDYVFGLLPRRSGR